MIEGAIRRPRGRAAASRRARGKGRGKGREGKGEGYDDGIGAWDRVMMIGEGHDIGMEGGRKCLMILGNFRCEIKC